MKKTFETINDILENFPKELKKKERKIKLAQKKKQKSFQKKSIENDVIGKWDENWWMCLHSFEREGKINSLK